MIKRIILLLLLVFLIGLNFPKDQLITGEDNSRECKCIGYSKITSPEERICYGLTHSCKILPNEQVILQANALGTPCKVSSCEVASSYMGIDIPNSTLSIDSNEKRPNTQILMIIDTSISMKGQSINDTIQAAIKLIDEMNPDDKVALITFNNLAKVIFNFSSRNDNMYQSIKDIDVKEDTRYLPALELADSMLTKLDDVNDYKILIFLSDGEPLDDRETILEITDKIKKMDTEVYTIWFGDEKSKSSDILEEMATSKNKIGTTDEKKFYTSEDKDTLYSSFKKIYQTIKKRDYIFLVEDNNPRDIYYDKEKIVFDLNLFSGDSNTRIPGYSIINSKVICTEKANLTVEIRNGNEIQKVPLIYTPQRYTGIIESLPKGDYTSYINISAAYGKGNDCKFKDYQFLRNFEVVKAPDQIKCPQLSCNEISGFIKDYEISSFNETNYLSRDIESRRILLAIDTSESMRHLKIEKVKDSLPYFISLFSKNYGIGLMTFSNKSTLLLPFTGNTKRINEKIKDITTGGTTNYIPAFKKAENLFRASTREYQGSKNSMIFISDGIPWDNFDIKDIEKSVESLTKLGVCIFTVGYGQQILLDEDAQKILKRIAEISIEKNKCGKYIQTYEANLPGTFSQIYKELKGGIGDLFIDTRINKQVLNTNDPLILSSTVSSDYNGIRLPSNQTVNKIEYGGIYNLCLNPAKMGIKIINEKGKTQYYPSEYIPGRGYYQVLSGFDKGIYNITLNATVSSGSESCKIFGTNNFRVRVHDNIQKKYSSFMGFYIFLNLILVVSFSLLLAKETESIIRKKKWIDWKVNISVIIEKLKSRK